MDKLYRVGYCVETGEPVMAGIWFYYETYGIPLEIFFETLFRNKMRISKKHLIQEMMASGMNEKHILPKIEAAFGQALFAIQDEQKELR